MVFSSHLFVFWFLPVALALYYLAPRRARHLVLTLLSYVFYGWTNPAFTLLMLLSTAIDYCAGLTIAHGGRLRFAAPVAPLPPNVARNRAQRLALVASIASNLSLLGFFKYFDFARSSYNGLMTTLGIPDATLATALEVTLPLGISFYTFQSMSYTIDVYRGQARALASGVDFACFVAMFPQLVAGPIVRFSEISEQLRQRRHTLELFARGCALFALGMAKKILLANPCGALADAAFAAAAPAPGAAWLGLVAYAFQIYFDFSGYSDMAIGLGLMLGFTFAKNFDSPYKSASLTEFWRRWHLSLSTWLRDYLYLPLGGNRRGARRTYLNLALVMLLGGLWHGAAWNFLLWGGWHGLLLAAERAAGGPLWRRWPRALQVAATFCAVNLGWVLFRARDLPHAADYAGALVGAVPPSDGSPLLAGVLFTPGALVAVALAAAIAFGAPQAWDWTRSLSPGRALACLCLLVAALVAMETQGYNPFLYFIF